MCWRSRIWLISVNPLFAFAFLEAFLATLHDYLGDVTETTIKDNFDIVYMVRFTLKKSDILADIQLIEEMLDEGHPMTMETAMLKDIVLPPTLMRKLLNVAGVSGYVQMLSMVLDLRQATNSGLGAFHRSDTLAKAEC